MRKCKFSLRANVNSILRLCRQTPKKYNPKTQDTLAILFVINWHKIIFVCFSYCDCDCDYWKMCLGEEAVRKCCGIRKQNEPFVPYTHLSNKCEANVFNVDKLTRSKPNKLSI